MIKWTNERKFKTIEIILFLFMCQFVFMFGAITNQAIVLKNGGRMPVESYYNFSDQTHFSFTNRSAITGYFWADIHEINYTVYSKGDFMIYGGAGAGFLSIIYLLGLMTYWRFFADKKRRSK